MLPFERTGVIDFLDYSKPYGINNIVVTYQEIVSARGDGVQIRQCQRALQAALVAYKEAAIANALHELNCCGGRPRNLLVAMAFLHMFRKKRALYEILWLNLLEELQFPLSLVTSPQQLLTVSVAINDPLLTQAAINIGADVNDCGTVIAPLHNAMARGCHEIVAVLIENGARVQVNDVFVSYTSTAAAV